MFLVYSGALNIAKSISLIAKNPYTYWEYVISYIAFSPFYSLSNKQAVEKLIKINEYQRESTEFHSIEIPAKEIFFPFVVKNQ